MPQLHIRHINHKSIIPSLHVNACSLSNEKVMNIFSFIACNLMIASNKQRQEHNNLAIMWRAKLKGAHVHFKNL